VILEDIRYCLSEQRKQPLPERKDDLMRRLKDNKPSVVGPSDVVKMPTQKPPGTYTVPPKSKQKVLDKIIQRREQLGGNKREETDPTRRQMQRVLPNLVEKHNMGHGSKPTDQNVKDFQQEIGNKSRDTGMFHGKDGPWLSDEIKRHTGQEWKVDRKDFAYD